MFAADLLLLGLAFVPLAPAADGTFTNTFSAPAAGEAVATIRAGCARCDWGELGREAAALRVSLDGRYSQHILLARGADPADYRVTLGAVGVGIHTLQIQ